jgi:phage tail sheath protein FI
MSAPGVTISVADASPPRTAPTDTSTWFVVGEAEKGVTDRPIEVRSLSQFVAKLGARQSFSVLYDAVEAFFAEGGSRVVVGRVVGPTPVKAHVSLNDSGASPTLKVQAKSPGAWGSSLNVQVTAGDAGGEFKLVISHDTLGALETSPSLADKTAAIAWAADSSAYVECVDLGGSNDPNTVAAQSLASGTDDRGNIADAHWQAALDLLTADLGPGQVSAPGRTTSTGHGQLLAHAAANNRVALIDLVDTATVATLTSAASTLRSTANARYGGAFAPWAKIPGLTAGTTRTVPYSAIQAGLIARSDSRGKSPNVAAAGANGTARFALGLSRVAWSDADRDTLNDAGVNVARELYGSVVTYGYRTLVDPVTKPNLRELSAARLLAAITARCRVVADGFLFSEIDGAGATRSAFAGALTGVLLPYWNAGSLYGETPGDAFAVDVSDAVNTPEQLAAGELRAVVAVRISPFAERVTIEIVKKPIDQPVA